MARSVCFRKGTLLRTGLQLGRRKGSSGDVAGNKMATKNLTRPFKTLREGFIRNAGGRKDAAPAVDLTPINAPAPFWCAILATWRARACDAG